MELYAGENMIIIQTSDARPGCMIVVESGIILESSLGDPWIGFPLGVLGQYMQVQAGPSRNLPQDPKSVESA